MPFTSTRDSQELDTPLVDDTPNTPQSQQLEVMHPSDLTKKRSSNEGSSSLQKSKRQSSATKLNKTLNRIVDAVETSATSVQGSEIAGQTIVECLEKLGNIPGVSEEDDFYIWAARLFLRDKYREMFMSLRTDDLRLRWLNLEIALEKTRILGFGRDF